MLNQSSASTPRSLQRVAHRLSLDYPESVHSLLILDIAPTVDVYLNTDLRFALYYWHWFFLVQPYPIPEQMILGAPQAYIKKMTVMNQKGGVHGGEEEVHPKEILESYTKTLKDPACVEATCEDYRQSSPLGLDFEHDKESRAKGQKVQAPFRVLWGANGVVENLYGREKQLAFWRGCCERLDEEGSKAVPSGHYIPEELVSVGLVERGRGTAMSCAALLTPGLFPSVPRARSARHCGGECARLLQAHVEVRHRLARGSARSHAQQ